MPQPLIAQTDVACAVQEQSDSTSPLLINEIMVRNDGTLIDPADNKDNEDWLEIYNPSNLVVDLQGLYLSDRLGDLTKHRITESLTIEPFGFLILFADDDSEQGADHLSFKLSNSGEAIALTESDGVTIIDSCIFPAQQENVPLGRLPDGAEWDYLSSATPGSRNTFVPVISGVLNTPEIPDAFASTDITAVVMDDVSVNSVTLYFSTTNINTNFSTGAVEVSMTPIGNDLYRSQIPGQASDVLVEYYIEAVDNLGGTIRSPIDAPNSTHKYLVGYDPPTLSINEFVADNISGLLDPDEPITATVSNKYPDWFEIYNYGNQDIDLRGLYLTDDRYNPTKNAISTTLVIESRETLIFYADEDRSQGAQHVNFRLSSAQGETIAIFGPFGASPIDIVEFGPQQPNSVLGRYPDGSGTLTSDLCVSPGEPNILCNRKTNLPAIFSPDRFSTAQ